MPSVTLLCPHADETDTEIVDCQASIEVELDWNPPERGWGCDADGNRGVDMPGYWTVVEVPRCCPNGHHFEPDELAMLEREARDAAREYRW